MSEEPIYDQGLGCKVTKDAMRALRSLRATLQNQDRYATYETIVSYLILHADEEALARDLPPKPTSKPRRRAAP